MLPDNEAISLRRSSKTGLRGHGRGSKRLKNGSKRAPHDVHEPAALPLPHGQERLQEVHRLVKHCKSKAETHLHDPKDQLRSSKII